MEAWSSSYTTEVWKVSYVVEAKGCSELVGCIVYQKRFLRHGSADGCTKLVGFIKYQKRFLCRGSME